MSNYTVSLVGPAPWGFRLQGGKDFNMPLTISRLSDGGKAARANVGIGDVVFTIDGISADGMTHLEAQNKIKACTGNLTMTLQRVASTTKPEPVPVQKGELKEVVKPVPVASAVAPKVTSTVNVAYNKAPRPFGAITSSKVTSIPSPSSAFTPAHVTGPSSHASPPPLATVTPPPFAASGLHANAKSSTDQRSPALSAVKTAVNIPRQPTTHNTALNALSTGNVQDVTEGQRRGFKENQGDSKQQNGKNPPKRPPRKHIVDTYTEFYHMPTHRDASKKRLIEDTEDWHPRTGTTQSRSFRILAQITGTDHMKEPEPDSTKKTNDSLEATQPVAYAASVKNMPMSPDTKSSTANITSATAVKPTEPQSAVKYSGWQPSNQAAQGWTSNSIAPSGAAAASTKSLMQPQRTEQDTLIQRAEHIPAGKRTPMCAQCDQVIRGPFLVALGKSWHPEEFNCAHCKTSMAYIGFVEEKGALYCEVCYEKFFAPECSRCQRKILGEVINALKQTWHVSCFVCVACHNPIRNNVFHLEDGDPYCETDYYSLFGTMCHGCEFPIEAGDKFLEALGHTWHDTCFVCSVCCDSLEGQTFFSKKDKPLCKKHAHSVNF
ncbi:PDZ and LIM domain protein 5 isoform X20 [Alligator sinensis]|uniref:PDZ and LIM domain protein 5 isoform X20 n=1 Tax=Alligator sinensis TaxID=38654 RepID=A0A3Q0G6K2_ALLSI|nr:PDZ and LIM domain protein 5 isoform X20 [Alligator sinensis]